MGSKVTNKSGETGAPLILVYSTASESFWSPEGSPWGNNIQIALWVGVIIKKCTKLHGQGPGSQEK